MIKPILFNTPMIRAILEGRKTMTRRINKDADELTIPLNDYIDNQPRTYAVMGMNDDGIQQYIAERRMPICVGDILWVRETWQYAYDLNTNERIDEATGRYIYAADGNPGFTHWLDSRSGELADHVIWRPSIHMPKAAARIFLRVTDVRVERLQDITEEDVCAEGAWRLITCKKQHGIIESDGTLGDMCWNSAYACRSCTELDPCEEKFGLIVWNSTIKKKDLPLYGWDANPWVWVYKFERVDKPEGWC